MEITPFEGAGGSRSGAGDETKASTAAVKRRFRPRLSLRITFVVFTLCALVCARVAIKRAEYTSQQQAENEVARRVSELSGRAHYSQWQGSRHWFGLWEHALLKKLFGSELTERMNVVDLERIDISVANFEALKFQELAQLELLLLYGCQQLDDGIAPTWSKSAP